ncbi:MAG: glycosyltransferase family 39 protein [bacterium]
MTISSDSGSRWTSGPALVLYLAVAKLFFHLFTAEHYGIFRDELYYLACSEHLAWGYVDQPPLIALVAWFARHVFGSSLLGLRLLPALAGAALVWLTGKLAREMGGDRFSQALAALATFAVPIFLVFHHWLTMNAFEPLIWLAAAWCVVRAVNTHDAKYWLWFGVLIGLGLETKYTTLFFAVGIAAGLVLTRHRRVLRSRWIWLGALAALLIFLPNLIWLVKHNFPFLELMRNIRHSGRDVARGPIAFIADQGMIMNPILFPLSLGGLIWLFFGRVITGSAGVPPAHQGQEAATDGRTTSGSVHLPSAPAPAPAPGSLYRIFGWAYVVMLVMFIVLKGKNYYLAPAYPILFAAGAIAFERLTTYVQSPMSKVQGQLDPGSAGVLPANQEQTAADSRTPSGSVHLPTAPAYWCWLRWPYVTLIILISIALAPLSAPILSPENYIRYQHALGLEPPKAENQNTGPLPQHFADEFGWEDMVREVAKVYNALPPEERAQTAIFCNSYGQAGAIDFFGPKYGLPKAISNHQNYWYWGPRDYTGASVIVLGSDGEGDREHFKTVEEAGHTYHPYSRRDEHFPILLCRGLNQDLHSLWPSIKKWN